MATEIAAPTPSSERIPPYNEEAERAVLGSALLDAARVVDLCVENQITPESFYGGHGTVQFAFFGGLRRDGRCSGSRLGGRSGESR